MRPLPARLTSHRLHQRRVEVWSRLERSGDIARATDDVLGSGHRVLRFELALPGWDLPVEATLVFVEWYLPRAEGWELTGYTYDYLREPRPAGRKAHHWHDGIVHAHCVDPLDPRPVAHFRDVQVDLLEAAAEFLAVHLRREIDCSGLFPLA